MATIGALIYKIGLDTAQLVDNTRQVEGQLGRLNGLASRAGSALKGAFTATAVIGWVKSAVEAGDQIGDLAAKAGVAASAFQRVSAVLQPAGVEMAQVGDVLVKLSDRLASGDKSAVAGLQQLGLSLEAVRAMSPDQAFLTIGEAVAGIEDPMRRAALAMDVFGKSGSQVIGGLTTSMKAAAAQAAVMDDATVDAMGQISDATDGLWRNLKRLMAEVLAPLAPVFSALAWGAGQLADALAWIGDKATVALGPLATLGSLVGDLQDRWRMLRGEITAPAAPAGPALPTFSTAAPGVPDNLEQIVDTLDTRMARTNAAVQAATAAQDAAARAAAAWAARVQALTAEEQLNKIEALAERLQMVFRTGQHLDPAQLAEVWSSLMQGIQLSERLYGIAPVAFYDLAMAMQAAQQQGRQVVGALREMVHVGRDLPFLMPTSPARLTSSPGQLPPPARDWSASIFGGLTGKDSPIAQMLKAIPATIASGDWVKLATTAASNVGNKIGANLAENFGKTITTGLSKVFGAGLGQALGGAVTALLPGLGGLVGPLVDKLFRLFSKPSESQLANTQVNEYLKQFTGDSFNQQFRTAQVAPEVAARLTMSLFNAKTREQATAAQQAITAILERNTGLLAEQEDLQARIVNLEQQRAALVASLVPTWEQVTGIAEKYGLNLSAAGQQVQQLQSTATFKGLLDDMETLERAGFNVGTMLDGLADDINAAVRQALQFGTTVPENMRKYLESLLQAGRLVDEHGQAMTDLSRIQFGPAIETQADAVRTAIDAMTTSLTTFADRLEEIIRLLASDLPAAAGAAAGAVSGIPSGERGPVYVPDSTSSRGDTVVVQNVLDGEVLSESVLRRVGGGAFAYAGVR